MDFLKKGLASASKMVGSASDMLTSGVLKERRDKSLEDDRQKLKALEKMLANFKKTLKSFQKRASSQSLAQLQLAQHIGVVYKASKSRQKSIREFIDIHTQLDSMTGGMFHMNFDDVVVSVIDEWADLTRKTAIFLKKTNTEINRLRKEEAEFIREKKQALKAKDMGRLTEEHRKEIRMRESRVNHVKGVVAQMKSDLKAMVKKLVDNRFSIFDECFVRLMETQVSYYEKAAEMVKSLKVKINVYRSKRARILSSPVEKMLGDVPPSILAPGDVDDVADIPEPMMREDASTDFDSKKKKGGKERHFNATQVNGSSYAVHSDDDEDEDESSGLDEPTMPSSDQRRQQEEEQIEKKEQEEKEQLPPRVQLTQQDLNNMATAEMYKKAGVAAFKESHFEEAVTEFGKALSVLGFNVDSSSSSSSSSENKTRIMMMANAAERRADEVVDLACSCLSNRAMCQKQLRSWSKIVKDASLCISLKPTKNIIMKNLINRGFAYEALGKMQEALNDFLSARNMGATTPKVLQTIGRIKKAAKQPKIIPMYESRPYAGTKASSSTTTNATATTTAKKYAAGTKNMNSQQQQQQPAAIPSIFEGLDIPSGHKPVPPSSSSSSLGGGTTSSSSSAAPPASTNLFDWDGGGGDGGGSSSGQQQPTAAAGSAARRVSNDWTKYIGGGNSASSVINEFNPNNVKPTPSKKSGGKRSSGIIFDEIFGSDGGDEGDLDVPAPSSSSSSSLPTGDDVKERGGGGGGSSNSHNGGPAQSSSSSVIFDDPGQQQGGPITQMCNILEAMEDQKFWHFAHDNLSPNQYARIPRDKKMAIRYLIKLGINNTSFVTSWETTLEEKRYMQALDQWEFRGGIRKDLMALLSGLHNLCDLVPWQGRKWKRVGLGDLQDPNARKKYFKKAMLIVHPDHNHSKPAAQRAITERAFTALTEALKQEA